MRSEFKFAVTAIIFAAAAFATGCAKPLFNGDEYNVGTSLSTISRPRADGGKKNNTIGVYDEKLTMIHQFDLNTMTKLRTLPVREPDQKHYVLHDPVGNYIIDLTMKSMTIIDDKNHRVEDTVKLQGKPKSAAFSPENGYFVLYDDLMNVGIVQLTDHGGVVTSVELGGDLGGATITSGDIVDKNTLALSLSDGSIASVDLAATIQKQEWVFTRVQTGLEDMKWTAPVTGHPELLMIRHSRGVALVNRLNGKVVSQVFVGVVAIYSKVQDAHIVSVPRDGNLDLVYADGATLKVKSLYRQKTSITTSRLDMKGNTWTLVSGDEYYDWDSTSGDMNIMKTNRSVTHFRFSDLFVRGSTPIPDVVDAELSPEYLFVMYPSDLGKAYRQDLLTGDVAEIHNFNVPLYDHHPK